MPGVRGLANGNNKEDKNENGDQMQGKQYKQRRKRKGVLTVWYFITNETVKT